VWHGIFPLYFNWLLFVILYPSHRVSIHPLPLYFPPIFFPSLLVVPPSTVPPWYVLNTCLLLFAICCLLGCGLSYPTLPTLLFFFFFFFFWVVGVGGGVGFLPLTSPGELLPPPSPFFLKVPQIFLLTFSLPPPFFIEKSLADVQW